MEIYRPFTSCSSLVQLFTVVAQVKQPPSSLCMHGQRAPTGDAGSASLRVFLHVGTRIVFREGRTKAVGSITKIYPHRPGQPTGVSSAMKHHKISHHHSKSSQAFLHQWLYCMPNNVNQAIFYLL